MKNILRIFLVAATALSLLVGSQVTAYAVGAKNHFSLFEQSGQAQQWRPIDYARQAVRSPTDIQRPPLPQVSEQAQEQARRAKEAIRQNGIVAPDIRHEGPSAARDTSLASTTYKGITISLFDSKVSKDTLSDIADALADIPELLLDKFSGTLYIVSDIRNVAANASADAIGMFLTTGDIYIEAWGGHEDTYVRTLAHELGHNLDWKLGLSAGYSTFMTASDSDWIALWEEYPTYQSQEGSLYSTVSIQEWFAEIIADYVCYPDYQQEYYPDIYDAVDTLF